MGEWGLGVSGRARGSRREWPSWVMSRSQLQSWTCQAVDLTCILHRAPARLPVTAAERGLRRLPGQTAPPWSLRDAHTDAAVQPRPQAHRPTGPQGAAGAIAEPSLQPPGSGRIHGKRGAEGAGMGRGPCFRGSSFPAKGCYHLLRLQANRKPVHLRTLPRVCVRSRPPARSPARAVGGGEQASAVCLASPSWERFSLCGRARLLALWLSGGRGTSPAPHPGSSSSCGGLQGADFPSLPGNAVTG